MVANHGADRTQRVILEQQLARLLQTALLKEVDNLRNGRLHRTALYLTERLFAAQTAICFLNDVDRHAIPLYRPGRNRLLNQFARINNHRYVNSAEKGTEKHLTNAQ